MIHLFIESFNLNCFNYLNVSKINNLHMALPDMFMFAYFCVKIFFGGLLVLHHMLTKHVFKIIIIGLIVNLNSILFINITDYFLNIVIKQTFFKLYIIVFSGKRIFVKTVDRAFFL